MVGTDPGPVAGSTPAPADWFEPEPFGARSPAPATHSGSRLAVAEGQPETLAGREPALPRPPLRREPAPPLESDSGAPGASRSQDSSVRSSFRFPRSSLRTIRCPRFITGWPSRSSTAQHRTPSQRRRRAHLLNFKKIWERRGLAHPSAPSQRQERARRPHAQSFTPSLAWVGLLPSGPRNDDCRLEDKLIAIVDTPEAAAPSPIGNRRSSILSELVVLLGPACRPWAGNKAPRLPPSLPGTPGW